MFFFTLHPAACLCRYNEEKKKKVELLLLRCEALTEASYSTNVLLSCILGFEGVNLLTSVRDAPPKKKNPVVLWALDI